MKIDPRHQTPLFLAAFGSVFLVVGVYAVYETHGKDTGLAGRLRAAPVVDAVSIQAQPPGATVLIEGRVSARNPQIESGLVTLQRQEAEAVRRSGQSQPRISWKTVGSDARPLVVDTEAGPLTIVNSDYAWRDVARFVPDDVAVVTSGTRRLAGFAAGDSIVAHATVVNHEGRPALKAVEIDGGSLRGYLASKQASDWVGYILGGIFALVGIATLGASVYKLMGSRIVLD